MIRLENIHKRYGSLEVLRGISLEVPEGKVSCIVGPSGAGKTTLLQIAGSLLLPDEGKVLFNDRDITSLKDKELSKFRNSSIGFVFQSHRLLPEFDITENVMIPALLGGRSRKSSRAEAEGILRELGLGERLHHKPAQLSGGECQRAAVARALVNSPEIIFADEPTGSLDSANRREIQQLFSNLRDSRGATFLIVTHDENLARGCDHVIEMKDGKIINCSRRNP